MKKIAALGVILSLTLVIIPVNTYATQNNLTGLKSNENNIKMSLSFDDLSLNDLEYFLSGNTSGKDWEAGFVKVNSTGKGFHLIWPIKILKLDLPIPTIQYHNIFPLKFDLFITKCRYCDENAKTNISVLSKSGEWIDKEPITGDHEITFLMFKIPVLNILRNLLADGIIDGIQVKKQFYNNFLNISETPTVFMLKYIRDKIFGGPLINLTTDQRNLSRDLSGVPPRYKGGQIFNLYLLKCFIEFLMKKNPVLATSINVTINTILNIFKQTFRINLALISGKIWNNAPLRTSFLHIVQPQQLKGYGFFVSWKKLTKSPPFMTFLQTIFPECFFYQDIKLI